MELFAKKSLGQHFLASPAALRQIIEAAQLSPGEKVLEIGPGTGILTAAILATGAHIVAVDKDARTTDVLAQKFSAEIAAGKAVFIEGDILDPKMLESVAEKGITDGSFSLVANIPYYITGAIMEQFLEHGPRPNKMVLLVQKEVAERIVARDAKESILSVSIKAFGVPRIVATVPRGAFVPPPNVDSAIISIEQIAEKSKVTRQKNLDIERFFKIVRAGFAHKRKFAIRNLEILAPDILTKESIAAAWSTLKLDTKIRPEEMPTETWIEIADLTANYPQK